MSHNFHIPVLGLGYSTDTPLKVGRYGISSVVSIVDDELTERMRQYHTEKSGEEYVAIPKSAPDSRAQRITAYLNLLDRQLDTQFEELKNQPFEKDSDLQRYFDLLPENSPLKQGYELMMEYPCTERKEIFQNILRSKLTKGAIDVNIMSKVDKMNFNADGTYAGDENTDALSSLRGFANSTLQSSLILSAGMNPRLYSYLEKFEDFYPDEQGRLKKKIILKVSDYRSALIQAKFLAKKGLWISEFRIESGLNCGGHAFATEGYLMGPILEEFKQKRQDMIQELGTMYQNALAAKGLANAAIPEQRISAQGGIGTADENAFLLDYYNLDATGWGSPFLLVPETTNVDESMVEKLTLAGEDDYYISNSSPLGILFNNFKHSPAEQQRLDRIERGRPGSPCTKKYLCTNTEFTELPICTASREYQNLKIKQLAAQNLPQEDFKEQIDTLTEKICLCEGLCTSAYIKNGLLKPKEYTAVSICPGPNLAYFYRTYSLDEMVKHIYGQLNLLDGVKRPHVFINELNLYIDYLQKSLTTQVKEWGDKKSKYFTNFKKQLQAGINYYQQLIPELKDQANELMNSFADDLSKSETKLNQIMIA